MNSLCEGSWIRGGAVGSEVLQLLHDAQLVAALLLRLVVVFAEAAAADVFAERREKLL